MQDDLSMIFYIRCDKIETFFSFSYRQIYYSQNYFAKLIFTFNFKVYSRS